MKKVHIVPHMHWDREWYFSTEESQILLVNNMEEIMEQLEENPAYPYYVLDGQTAVLEDYFAAKPENRERVRQLVSQGKLIIGPWYTQTDEMVVGGESIVRNLLYGMKDAAEFGTPMKIGYLPDSFGQSAQMPQILNGFGIRHAIFWRGASERHGATSSEFNWASDDGSRVLVQQLPLGYAIGKYLPEDEVALKARMDKNFAVLDQRASTENRLIPNGHDQMPVQRNILPVIEKLKRLYPDREFFLSKYEDLFADLEKHGHFPTLKGEFLDGKYMRVHRSIYSTRMDLKAANARIENKITNILEPLASLAYSLGFEYQHGLMALIWKELMKNHAHDSIGCCCSDKVHQEIAGRFFLAEERTDRLIQFYQRKIVDSVATDRLQDRLTAFNLLPYERDEVVTTTVTTKLTGFKLVDDADRSIPFTVLDRREIDPGLIDRQIVAGANYEPFLQYTVQFRDHLPSMGYKTYFVVDADAGADADAAPQAAAAPANALETDFYRITANPNGTLEVLDKPSGRTYSGVLRVEDGGDDGDEYDYSPLAGERLLSNDQVAAQVSLQQTPFAGMIEIRYALPVPGDLAARQAGRLDSTVDLHFTVTVPNHQPRIDVTCEIDNRAKEHRLRVLIPTGIAAAFATADNQFGTIARPVVDPALAVWEQEHWDERPDAIYPMLSFVDLADGECGVAVLTGSTREYEIVGAQHDTIAVTLFRSVGVLGKENLVRRPGRPSGIKLPTPDSQLLGRLTLQFAIAIHPGSTHQANVARIAREYLTPVVCYNKIPYDAMRLNPSGIQTPVAYSLLHEDDSVVLSTLKKAEKSDRLLLRFYNATDTDKIAHFTFSPTVTWVESADLNEQTIAGLPVQRNQVQVKVKPNQVRTILF